MARTTKMAAAIGERVARQCCGPGVAQRDYVHANDHVVLIEPSTPHLARIIID